MNKQAFAFFAILLLGAGCAPSVPENEILVEAENLPIESSYDGPVIYVSIFTHAEEPKEGVTVNFSQDEEEFWTQRELVVDFATMLHEKGVAYNYQSDWNFLEAALKFDEGTEETNGKNFLQYLYEDLGFEIDPHSHGSQFYNAADVAYLIKQLGVTPSGVMAGLIAAPANLSELEILWQPIEGSKYDNTWTAEILWGGGTGLHIDETSLWISGIWKPQDAEHYTTHDDNAPLATVGRYKSNWEGLQDLLVKQENGELEDGKIYTVSIDAHQKNFTPEFIEEFAALIDQHMPYTEEGRIQWVGITEVYNIWLEDYNAEPNQTFYES